MSLSELIKGQAKHNHSNGKLGPCRLMTVARLSPRGWKHRAPNELRDRSFKADTWWRCYDAPVVGGGEAGGGGSTTAHISRGALTISLTQCLVELCHLWMVPACGLGLMATGGQKDESEMGEADDRKKEIRMF